MKTRRHPIRNRILSMLICLVMIFGMIPVVASAAAADNRVVDPSTMDSWKTYFGPDKMSTENAGGVWTDKSVFKDNSAFASLGITMDDPDNNFLVALSALASTKEITGYASLPTDTMLVLDVSGSMQGNDAVAMVNATNAAIDELMKLSKYNRVGVVLYSGNHQQGSSQASTGTVILPLDHYTTSSTTTFRSGNTNKTVGKYLNIAGSGNDQTVSIDSTVRNSNGDRLTSRSKTVRGGTYIQNGLYQAWTEFERVARGGTVIAPESIQGGTQRVPIVVLMSDGEPTAGTDSFNNVGTSNRGDGMSSSNQIAFLTQLTAAWINGKISAAYNNTDPLFYTLGLGTESSGFATSVLNPSSMAANSTLRGYWSRYLSGNADGNNRVTITGNGNSAWRLAKDPAVTSYTYTDRYWLAENAADLIAAFDDIVQQITIQTEYYPTLITSGQREIDGYITFEDDLGEFMEVKDVKGIVIGDILFSGEEMASVLNTGALGTPGVPSDLGNEFVWTVMERMGITDVSDAQQLIDAAFNAGQLHSDSTSYSNYIGWYADANGNYLAPWNESHTPEDYPKQGDVYAADAVYINRSYGYLGKTGVGNIGKTDMMHVVVKVETQIATNRKAVHFSIPAALIPVVTYHVSLNGDTYAAGQTGTLTYEAADPIRLVFEVGLRSDINAINVAQIVGTSDHYHMDAATGAYEFFTNRWGSINSSNPADFDYSDPFSHLVAVSSLHPSLENERYYYAEDAVIYTDRNGTKHTGGKPADKDPGSNSSGYYHMRYIVEATSGSNAVVRAVYEPIHDDSLTRATLKNGSYVIPKGTVLKMIEQFNMPKNDNPTGTLEYFHHPYVAGNQTANYTAYTFLGNNGKMSLTPAAGIALRKEVSEAIDGVDTFTFTVTNVPEGYAVTDENGKPLSNVTATLNGSTLRVTMPAGQTVYITGLTGGSQCTVTEAAGSNFSVTGLTVAGLSVPAANAATVTVPVYNAGNPAASQIIPVTFTNSPIKHGSLIVSKDVLHPYDTPPAELTQKPFRIYVDLGADMGGKAFPITGKPGVAEVTANAQGIISLALRNDESVTISGIPAGTAYTVTEDMNDPIIGGESFSYKGYTNISGTITGTVAADSTHTAAVINRFNPTETSSSIVFNISKNITNEGSAQYSKDYTFSFKLEQYDPTAGTYNQLGSTVTLKNGESASFAPLAPNALGTYYYKVSEIIPANEADRYANIAYDATTARIVVFVTDDDADGVLEYVVKDYATNEILQPSAPGVYTLEKVFNNVYNEDLKPTFVEFTVDKTVRDDFGTGINGAGFLFQLTEVNEDGSAMTGGQFFEQRTQLAGSKAQATFHLPITQAGDWYYKLTEFKPTVHPIPGMNYDTTVYYVVVSATVNPEDSTKLDTAYTIATGNFAAAGGTVVSDNETRNGVGFTNVLHLTPATLPLYVNKVLNGRDPKGAEFTFTLTQTDSAFTTPTGYTDSKALGEGSAAFNTLTFSKAGSYYYVIRETAGSAGGVNYDGSVYHVTVTVSAVGDALVAVPSVTKLGVGTVAADQITFTNDYTAKPVPFAISGNKVLRGNKILEKDAFTFALYENGVKIAETTNNANGGFAFEAITYHRAGSYTYEVREVSGSLPGVTYDPTVYDVFVSVTDNGDGTLSASATYGADNSSQPNLVFNNSYKATPGYASISGTKKLTGRPLSLQNKEFTFVLYGSNETFSALGSEVTRTQNDVDGKFVIGLGYENPGKYHYILKEDTTTLVAGVNYSTLEYHITVTVSDPGNGAMLTTVEVTAPGLIGAIAPNALHFTNTYAAEPVPVELAGTKTVKDKITGAESVPAADTFTFELYNAVENVAAGTYMIDGAVLQSKKNDAQGSFQFDQLNFTKAGVYHYMVVELNDGQYDIDYDETQYLVSVDVRDDNSGSLYVHSLKVAGSETESIRFVNIYDPTLNPKAGEVVIDVNKLLDNGGYTGVQLGLNGYRFQIQGTNTPYADVVTTDANGKAAFLLSYNEFDIGNTYTYKITEIAGSNADIIYSDSEFTVSVSVGVDDRDLTTQVLLNGQSTTTPSVTFTNKYDPKLTGKETTVTVDVTKVVENAYAAVIGRDGFKFQLVNTADPSDVSTVISGTNGKAAFTRKYTEQDIGKTFTYEISEIAVSGTDMDFSTARFTLVVKVSLDAQGKLVAEMSLNGVATTAPAVTFTNTYDPTNTPKETQVTVDVTKVVENEYATAVGKDGFRFQMVNTENADDTTTAVSNADGKTSFTKKFTEADIGKTFTYEITEVDTKIADILYSTAKHTLTVTVTVDTQGALAAITKLDGTQTTAPAVTFTNKYDPTATEKVLQIPVDITKYLNNKTATKAPLNGFKFELLDVEGKVRATTESDKDGKASFQISFTQEHIGKTFTYELSELDTNIQGITYDKTVYTFTVTVGVDTEGHLTATLTKDGQAVQKLDGAFNNTYDGPPPPPMTGDDTPLMLWAVLMILCACAVVVLAMKWRKEFCKK